MKRFLFGPLVLSLHLAGPVYAQTTGTGVVNAPPRERAASVSPVTLKALQASADAKSRVEASEKDALAAQERLFSELDAAISQIDGTTLSGEAQTLISARQVISLLKSQAENIQAAHHSFLTSADAYSGDLTTAKKTLADNASKFESFAAAEPYTDLRDQYHVMAKAFTALAKRIGDRQELLSHEIRLVDENLAYVNRTQVLLARVDEALAQIPDLSGTEVQNFLSDVRSYSKHFEKFKDHMQRLKNTLSAQMKSEAAPQMQMARTNAKKGTTK